MHGNEIVTAAAEKRVSVSYEGAVAGGITIIKRVWESLSAYRIEWIAGIMNGTCKFILSPGRDKGLSLEEAVAQSKALAYAEAVPTFDMEGKNSAHKITVISARAFGTPVEI
jgi:Homoserine dehydrogenase